MKKFIIFGLLLIALQMHAIQIWKDIEYVLHNGNGDGNMIVNGELHAVEQLIKADMTLFDIGANVGEWSACVLKKHPEIALYAFVSLEKRLSSHRKSRCFCLAASNSNGELPLFFWEPSAASLKAAGIELASLFHRPIVDKLLAVAAKKIAIQAQKLDSFCDQHTIHNIDFLKIDTEGSELNVLVYTDPYRLDRYI